MTWKLTISPNLTITRMFQPLTLSPTTNLPHTLFGVIIVAVYNKKMHFRGPVFDTKNRGVFHRLFLNQLCQQNRLYQYPMILHHYKPTHIELSAYFQPVCKFVKHIDLERKKLRTRKYSIRRNNRGGVQ